jgi:phage baseplate assembly protein gpV
VSNPDGYFGTQLATSRTSEYNAVDFVVRSILSGRAHVALVQVIAVTPGEGVESLGTVDVQPMVNQLDADGAPIPHGVVNGLPWLTLQAGPNAIRLTPEVGDRGLCVFSDRDISSVKSTREIANPGSYRQADMADGMYVGGFLNDDATQWIKMDADGIVIHSPTLIKFEAPEVRIDADAVNVNTDQLTVNGTSQFNGNVSVDGDVDVSGNIDSGGTITASTDVIGGGISLKSHTHSGVTPGGGTSGPPVP